MRLKTPILLLTFIGCILTVNNYAFAHKVNLFCYLEGSVLNGEGYYRGGRPAQKAEIEVYSLSNNSLIIKTATDTEGKFKVSLDVVDSFKIIMNAGQGHKAEFIIEKEKNVLSENVESLTDKTMLETELNHLIEKKTKPLEQRIRDLEKQQSESGIVPVAGGLGLITGIFAFIYLMKKKHAL
ncbi:MAG: hypothetical protein KAR05_04160 [Candidatus Omnitrophica bacterium]|nr:hypothetical protein [Candidatus Omnitrophota bacterium]